MEWKGGRNRKKRTGKERGWKEEEELTEQGRTGKEMNGEDRNGEQGKRMENEGKELLGERRKGKNKRKRERSSKERKEVDTHRLNHSPSINTPHYACLPAFYLWFILLDNGSTCLLIISPVAGKEAVMLPARCWQSHPQADGHASQTHASIQYTSRAYAPAQTAL